VEVFGRFGRRFGCRRLVIDVFVEILVRIRSWIPEHSGGHHMRGVAEMSLRERLRGFCRGGSEGDESRDEGGGVVCVVGWIGWIDRR